MKRKARPFTTHSSWLTANSSFFLFFSFLFVLLPSFADQPPPTDTRVFNYAVTGEVDSLDPAWEFDALSTEVVFQMYENLITYEGPAVDKFESRIAADVPSKENGLISKDGLRYTFPIRKGIVFHDGSPLTPEDVKYSFMRFLFMDRLNGPSFLLLKPLLNADATLGPDGKPDRALFERAEKAISIQAGALVLTLPKPCPYLLALLASNCPIVSKAWTVAHGGWDGQESSWPRFRNPVKEYSALYDKVNGTGPFMLDRWDKSGKEVVLTANGRYWRGAPKLSRVVYRSVDDPATRLALIKSGQADAIVIERQYAPQLQDEPGVQVYDDEPLFEVHDVFIPVFHVDPIANPYIGSGTMDGRGIPPDFFSNIMIRRGFAMAFDYDRYIREGYGGQAERAHGPIPKGIFGYDPFHGLLPHDPERAKAAFKRAMAGDVWEQGFRFTIGFTQGRKSQELAAVIMKQSVEALNPKFHIDVKGLQSGELFEAFVGRKIPMQVNRWVMDYPDPSDSVYPFLDSQGYYARVQGYKNPLADGDIEQARFEEDLWTRRKDYYDLQSIAREDVPQIYTVDTMNVEATRSWVKDWTYNPIFFYGYLYPVHKKAQ